jgi:hypothetical protein
MIDVLYIRAYGVHLLNTTYKKRATDNYVQRSAARRRNKKRENLVTIGKARSQAKSSTPGPPIQNPPIPPFSPHRLGHPG